MKEPHMREEERDVGVIVIGAGMTGIAAGYYLARAGVTHAILEAEDGIGGVWHSQRWHGVRCDSDIVKYSFSFRPFLSSRCLEDGAAIRAYLRQVAEESGILQRIRFGTRVLHADFSRASGRWTVRTSRGVFTSRFILNGNGYFSNQPHVPHFRDAERFAGELVHAAHLDGSRSFEGQRVVVVGSGSTAICLAPQIARSARSVVLVQRSPSYVYEVDNRPGRMTRLCQRLHACGLPFALRWLRAGLQARDDAIFVLFRRFPGAARAFFRRHWLPEVGADALDAHFTPRYNPWEQRIPVAVGLKACLRDGSVTLRTARIERLCETGVALSTGETVQCDVCVLATGLELEFFKFGLSVDGAPVALERVNLFKGLMIGGVPNYFHPMGSWHSAWTQRMEPLIRLALRIMRHMDAKGFRTVSVERRQLPAQPGITSNYVMRALSRLPRFEGTTNLPSIDNLFAPRVASRRFSYA